MALARLKVMCEQMITSIQSTSTNFTSTATGIGGTLAKSGKLPSNQEPDMRISTFVTGNIDPLHERAEFLAYFQALTVPVLLLVGEQVPPNSKAEMDAITELPGVQTSVLPGSLRMHEEYPTAVFEAISKFL